MKHRDPVAPPIPEFVFGMPIISAQELDVMRLTAQFVARNGSQFHSGLLNREFKNTQFEFLKSSSPLNIYFTALVDSYTRVLLPPRNIVNNLQAEEFRKKDAIIDKALSYLEFELAQERAKKTAEEEKEAERVAMAQIDWHDFVPVETIDFSDDEAELPAPASVEELETQMGEMDMEEEDTTKNEEKLPLVPALPEPEPENIDEISLSPPSNPAPPPSTHLKILSEPIKRTRANIGGFMTVCPLCKQQIPENEINEHLRIEMLHPKYAEQRKLLETRNKEIMNSYKEDITENLRLLRDKRTDIFGGADEELDIGKSFKRETLVVHPLIPLSSTEDLNPNLSKIGPSVPVHLQNLPPTQHIPIQPPVSRNAQTNVVHAQSISSLYHSPIAYPYPGMGVSVMPGMYATLRMFRIPPNFAAYTFPPISSMAPPGMDVVSDSDGPAAKRQKADEINLIPEDQFLLQHSGPISVIVQVPTTEEKSEWNFKGQQLTFMLNPRDTIKMLKDKIQGEVGIPQNKQKLKIPGLSVLKDHNSLAFYNISPGTHVALGLKERGGRNK